MTTQQKSAAHISGIEKANETALKGFPKSKLRQAFEAMSAAKETGEASNEARSTAALKVCQAAVKFRENNPECSDVSTFVKGWRDNMAPLAMELALSNNKFAELIPAKDGKPAKAKLTGYGNNVASIAKGCLEFSIEPKDSYRDTRKAVEGARAEARRLANPDAASFADAVDTMDAAWDNLRKLIVGTEDSLVVAQIRDLLDETRTDVEEQLTAPVEEETVETVEETPAEVAAAA